ncbi:MAG: glycosyltransferase family 2 protein [Prevotella sp.]|nr:glycosyltransferase family 2 protein [Prevotella sp.]
MKKILSIAIPTLNRAEYLKFTIEVFVTQLQPYADFVELVICSNACEDRTSDVVHEFERKYEFIRYKECDNRVSLGDNFKRTVDFSDGEFVILWGDDDIPAPFLVGLLLQRIKDNRDIELYYFNRLVGYEDGCPIRSLTVYENRFECVERLYKDSSSFINDNFWGATFMSAVMFSRKVWERGLLFDTSSHYGFEFMGILYYGNQGKGIMYECFPLCIQRKVAKRAWGTDWPIYALIGLPNMSRDLEKEGLFINGLDTWRRKYNNFVLYCYILMSAATDKKKYKPYCRRFAAYQRGFVRKSLAYLIIYFMPGWVYNISRKILFSLKK